MSQTLKLCSWNVNGLRAVSKKGFFEWLENSGFDIVCLQEAKVSEDQIDGGFHRCVSYPHFHLCSAERKGYSGVANYFKNDHLPETISFGFTKKRFAQAKELSKEIANINAGKTETTIEYGGKKLKLTELEKQLRDFNSEGRIIESWHPFGAKNKLVLLNIYFPNGGASTERLKFKLEFYEAFLVYLKELEKETPYIVVTGDYNTAHHAIDLARPKENTNTSGFMDIERVYLDELEALGFKDSFRIMHPDETDKYTWWSFRTAARKRNVGWRIDYFFISEALIPKLKEASIHNEVEGSDHCPISIILQDDSAQ